MEADKPNKNDLLKRMREGHERLESALGQLTEEQISRPDLDNGWSVKDLLAHIAWWEQRTVNLFYTLKRGEQPTDVVELDELNERVFNENKYAILSDIRRKEHEAFQAMLKLVENATNEDLFDPKRFSWTEGREFYSWIIGNSFGHYDEHMGSLRQFIQKVKNAG